MVMVKDSNIVVSILSLLALTNTGASNNAGNKAENRPCFSPVAKEGKTGRLTFFTRRDLLSSRDFVATLKRAQNPAEDILVCTRQPRRSQIECSVNERQYLSSGIEGRRLKLQIPNVTRDFEDTYVFQVYARGFFQHPDACRLVVKANKRPCSAHVVAVGQTSALAYFPRPDIISSEDFFAILKSGDNPDDDILVCTQASTIKCIAIGRQYLSDRGNSLKLQIPKSTRDLSDNGFSQLSDKSDLVFEGPAPRKFRVRTSTVENGKHGWALVTSVLVTDYGQLLMADFLRNEVKMVSLKNPNTVLSSVRASGNPDSLLQLLDGRVMVCFRNAKKLLIITVNGDSLAVDATLTTNREYAGLAQGPTNTVIASAPKRGSLHGRLDVLDLKGNVVRTILDDTSDNYRGVNYLTRFGEDVFLSDHEGHKVRAVNIATGTVTSTFRGLDLNSLNLKEPRDITFDRHGNMYFGVLESKLCSLCYIQISQGGRATALSWVSADTTSYPYGVTTTSTHLIVSWWHTMGGRSEVTAYQLPF